MELGNSPRILSNNWILDKLTSTRPHHIVFRQNNIVVKQILANLLSMDPHHSFFSPLFFFFSIFHKDRIKDS